MSQIAVEHAAYGPLRRIVLTDCAPPKPAQVSVYLVGDTLVDTGGSRVGAALLAALAATTQRPKRIVCTHQHEDHVGNIAALRRVLGDVPVYVPRALLRIIARAAPVPHYRAEYWGTPEPPGPADTLVPYDPGASFDVGPCTLEALLTPGHTPHHVALTARVGETRYVLSGDLYTSRPLEAWYESAIDDMIASWRMLADWGEALFLLPTHGRARSDGARVLQVGADWLAREADAIRVAALRLGTEDPRTIAQVRYPGPDPMDVLSGGEISRAAFVRSVLAPVRELPADAP